MNDAVNPLDEIRLLDLALFRVGSESYTRDHGSFGLATVRRDHVRTSGDVIRFDYRAKSGQRRIQEVADAGIAIGYAPRAVVVHSPDHRGRDVAKGTLELGSAPLGMGDRKSPRIQFRSGKRPASCDTPFPRISADPRTIIEPS